MAGLGFKGLCQPHRRGLCEKGLQAFGFRGLGGSLVVICLCGCFLMAQALVEDPKPLNPKPLHPKP